MQSYSHDLFGTSSRFNCNCPLFLKQWAKWDDPYNRGLFVRKSRGEYLLNPEIAFEMAEDQWVEIPELLRLIHPMREIGQHRGGHWLKDLWSLPVAIASLTQP
jgi:hypothetical protein